MRGCDVCGRAPKWLQLGPYDLNVALLCGYHARAYLNVIPIPRIWIRAAKDRGVYPEPVAQPIGED